MALVIMTWLTTTCLQCASFVHLTSYCKASVNVSSLCLHFIVSFFNYKPSLLYPWSISWMTECNRAAFEWWPRHHWIGLVTSLPFKKCFFIHKESYLFHVIVVFQCTSVRAEVEICRIALLMACHARMLPGIGPRLHFKLGNLTGKYVSKLGSNK